MAKKKNEIIENPNPILPLTLEDIMGDRFGRYSKYIIQERALPDARDGLKPVQRRILYAMYHDGNVYDKQHRKSAKTVGLVIGNYHPHGDSSVYEAMVRLSQDWKIRMPLIDMHGNNGSIDDDPAAAMRYTEARLAKASCTMCEDLDKDTVLYSPNFDDTELEPTVLPTKFPTLLINGCTGIAAGYATNIAPHNFDEVIDATIHRIQHPNCSLDSLMKYIIGPDFPTGGIVMGKSGIVDAFKTGKGKIIVRSKCEIVDAKSCQQIIVTEIPYEVIKAQLVKKMDEIRINKDIDGILDVRDESDRNGLRIVIDIKKDADANLILNYFYKNTDLQTSYNYNNVGIIDQRPVQMSLFNMLDTFITFRKEVIYKRSKYQYDKMEKRLHILEGLIKAVSVMDEIIAIIRASKDKADSKIKLIERFGFTDTQAEAIVVLRLYRLSNTDVFELKEEYKNLVQEMEQLNTILNNQEVLDQVVIKELREVKKEFSSPRRTAIVDEIEEIVIDKLSMISNEKVMITVSKDGYVKRVSLRSYGASDKYATGLKESDELIGTIECETLDTLLLFTTLGNYAYLPVYQIDEFKWKDIGNHVNNYVKCSSDEKIVNAIVVKNFNSYVNIVTISKLGFIKQTLVSDFNVSRNSKVLTAMKLKGNDQLMKAFVAYESDEVLLVTKNGYSSRYNLDLVSATAPKSQGVKAINLSKDDFLSSACVINSNHSEVVLFTTKGLMKRFKTESMTITNRPVKGELLCKKLKSNPYEILDVRSCSIYDEIVLFDNSEAIVLQAKDVTLMSKDATFSNVITVSENFFLYKGIEEVLIIDKSNEKLVEAKAEKIEKTEEVEDQIDHQMQHFEEEALSDYVRLEEYLDDEEHFDFETFSLFDDDK